MTERSPKALLVPIHQNSLEVQALLAEAMLADGRLRPLMLAPDPRLEKSASARLEGCCRIAGLDDMPVKRGSLPEGRKICGSLGLALAGAVNRINLPGRRFIPGLEPAELMKDLVADYRRSLALLELEKPQVVVLSDDRKFGVNMSLLKAARDLGCLTILVPVALAHCRDAVPINRQEDARFQPWKPGQWLAKFWIRKRLPGQVYYAPEGPFLFFTPAQTLALAGLNMLPRNPWCPGGGDTDLVALTGKSDQRRYTEAGVPANKLVITGDPNLDQLYESSLVVKDLRSSLINKYTLDSQASFLVCAVPQLAEHKILPWERHWQEMRWLGECLMSTGYNVLLSLHPKSDPAQYQWMAKELHAVLLDEPLREVLPAADVFVSGFSSTVRWASLLRIPTVVLDLYGLSHHYLDHLHGLRVVRQHQDLFPLLEKLRQDSRFYKEMKNAQEREGHDIARFDGNACLNIIDAICNELKAREPVSR